MQEFAHYYYSPAHCEVSEMHRTASKRHTCSDAISGMQCQEKKICLRACVLDNSMRSFVQQDHAEPCAYPNCSWKPMMRSAWACCSCVLANNSDIYGMTCIHIYIHMNGQQHIRSYVVSYFNHLSVCKLYMVQKRHCEILACSFPTFSPINAFLSCNNTALKQSFP